MEEMVYSEDSSDSIAGILKHHLNKAADKGDGTGSSSMRTLFRSSFFYANKERKIRYGGKQTSGSRSV